MARWGSKTFVRGFLMLLAAVGIGLILSYVTLSVLIAYAWSHAADPVFDQTRYEELLKNVRGQGYGMHFPDTRPENTIGFCYVPHFLQGPLVLQLRLAASQEIITQIEESVPKKTVVVDSLGKSIDSNHAPGPYVFWDKKSKKNRPYEIPRSFEFWSHRGVARSTYEEKPSWNHGDIEGVAIDRVNGEVLYYTESW